MSVIKIVQYKIKPEKKDIFLDELNIFLEEIELRQPNVKQRTFNQEDGVTFIHLFEFPSSKENEDFWNADYTKHFFNYLTDAAEGEIKQNILEEV